MTAVLLTVDTEFSLAAYQRGVGSMENFAAAILGQVSDGEWGIRYQAKLLNAHGLKAVFFVEALCADVVGLDVVKRTVDPILSMGHAVELHIHTEWLQWHTRDPVDGQRGRCMADFSYDHQCRLLELGIENLMKAGAPTPVAFRAGNYGANNDTLRALAHVGIKYDSSYNLPYLDDTCRIITEQPILDSVELEGVVEVPVTFFRDYPAHNRSAQICAASASEMRLIIQQSLAQQRRTVVVVGHSFELLNRARSRANRLVVRRFTQLCEMLDANKIEANTADFASLDPTDLLVHSAKAEPLQSSIPRTALRMVQQAAGTVLYG